MLTALAPAPGRHPSEVSVLWDTSQFTGTRDPAATTDRVSARAAYQLVLHRRAARVDIRPEVQRRAEGCRRDRRPAGLAGLSRAIDA